MNRIILLGNLSRDPEVSTTNSGKNNCKFSIAVNDSYSEDVNFFDCIAWGNTGDTIARYFKKGRKILIEGRVKIDNYEKDGVKKRSWWVVVEKFYFVNSSGEVSEQDNSGSSQNRSNSNSSGSSNRKEPDSAPELDDDLPF